ncbi:MAG: pantetheine-phosphate adenylyltransferase [Phycisphaerae bacterium]|nr:pantetheine-phosphate adenylyltransferase [Phycisphaerae bacterium]
MPENKYVRALFPGSFDPITNGHLDVIRRASVMFDEVIVAVGDSPKKEYLFTGQERLEMIHELVADMPEVKEVRFVGLTVECAQREKAQVILRGLRNLADVQYEFQLALTNRAIGGIETVFIMTGEKYGFTTSTLIREVGRYGGDVSGLVPPNVFERLKEKLSAEKGL